MKFLRKLLGKRKRPQARYVFDGKHQVADFTAAHALVDITGILQTHPIKIGAREYNKLPAHLQEYFKRGVK